MYHDKSIIRFGFCDIQNNQGRGKGYKPKPKPKASADNPYLDLDSSGYQENLIQWWFTKLEYNNLVKFTYILIICESSLVDDVVLSCLKPFIYVTSIRFSVTNIKFPRYFMNWIIFYLSSNIKV